MDKTLFITGASSGIGAATARAAVQAGWRVGLFARSKDKLDSLAESLGDKAMTLAGDATDLDSQRKAMKTFATETGGIDAAFANAGMGLSAAGTDAGDPSEWEQMIRLNILGVLWTVKAAMPMYPTMVSVSATQMPSDSSRSIDPIRMMATMLGSMVV